MDIFSYLSKSAEVIDGEIEKTMSRDKKPKEVYGPIWDFLDRGGKRFRPALCLLSCKAVGGNPKKILPVAASIELFHEFTLIHDDLADDSLMRRGKPCLHKIYGAPLALNAGDGLFMMVWKSLLNLETEPEKLLSTQKTLLSAFTSVLEGQGVELGWRGDKEWRTTERDYFKMVGGKTGALISAACEVGAYLGGGTKKEIAALREFGMSVGVGFQIQDDILNLVGEEKKYKKEIGGDITEGKRTLMVIHFLRHAPREEKDWLARLLDSHTTEEAKIRKAILLLKKRGSIDYAKKIAEKTAKNAKRKLSCLRGSDAKNALSKLADFLIEREI